MTQYYPPPTPTAGICFMANENTQQIPHTLGMMLITNPPHMRDDVDKFKKIPITKTKKNI